MGTPRPLARRLSSVAAVVTLAACKPRPVITVDGSSTVFPISAAVAEEYNRRHGARLSVGLSGTGGGFKKLCIGELDMIGASRPVKDKEMERCAAHDVGFIELPIAHDGIVVAIHPDNTWAREMTVADLRTIWEPAAQRTVTHWSDVRPEWPHEKIQLFGPGHDSGTFDYFTDVVNGKEGDSRGDFTTSEDDNVLVTGIAGERYALGFYGIAYHDPDRLQAVAIKLDDDAPAIAPTLETVGDGSYFPLSRPLFLYVSERAAARPDVRDFVKFYLLESAFLVREVGFVPLTHGDNVNAWRHFSRGVTGTFDWHLGITTPGDLAARPTERELEGE